MRERDANSNHICDVLVLRVVFGCPVLAACCYGDKAEDIQDSIGG